MPHTLLSLLFRPVEPELARLCRSGEVARGRIAGLSLPFYLTDADGRVVAWNEAAARFAGRPPSEDNRWTICPRLKRCDGAPLDAGESPMARAMRDGRPVRGVVALSQRPDGTLTPFTPFPTPVTDEAGRVAAGFNMLLDVSDAAAAVDALISFVEELRQPELEWAAA